MFLGPQALRKVIEDAELYPIRGLFSFKDFFPEIDNYFLGIHGDELGIHTGWKSLDDLYKVKKVLLHYSIFLSSLVKVGSQEELAFFIITVMLLRASSQVLCSQKLNLAICFLCLPYDTISFNLLSICSVQQCLPLILSYKSVYTHSLSG